MNKLLYFDMEWVPMSPTFEQLKKDSPLHADAWSRRCEKWRDQEKYSGMTDSEIWLKEAGFYPEFIKIIVISFGYYKGEEFKVDSCYGHNEKDVLTKAKELLDKVGGTYSLCGHSIKRFDMPYLAKRMAIHGLSIPYLLNNGEKKPWEITAVDIAESWGFGCNQEKYTPLDWMCVSLGIETSKTDISGKDVAKAYWVDDRLNDIKVYCEADVVVSAKVERALSKLINPAMQTV